MQIPKINSRVFLIIFGILSIVIITSSATLFLNSKSTKPEVAGISTITTTSPTTTPSPSSTPSPTPTTAPKITKKPISSPTPIATLAPTNTQTSQPTVNATSNLAKDAACKNEADIKKNEFINQEMSKLRSEHPEYYSYDAAVAKDPGKYSSQIDPDAAFKFWLSEAQILSSSAEGIINSTGTQLYGAYYAQCLSK